MFCYTMWLTVRSLRYNILCLEKPFIVMFFTWDLERKIQIEIYHIDLKASFISVELVSI